MALLVSSVPVSLTTVLGLPRSDHQPVQFPRHADAGERGIGDQRQAFAGAVIHTVRIRKRRPQVS
ncbi:hypothetical protein XI05_09435 [Bradyrhizobium sp. CCBAU 11357]|nr:hypothetical protein [Bradyrhizobium sp. CCBAU 11357]